MGLQLFCPNDYHQLLGATQVYSLNLISLSAVGGGLERDDPGEESQRLEVTQAGGVPPGCALGSRPSTTYWSGLNACAASWRTSPSPPDVLGWHQS